MIKCAVSLICVARDHPVSIIHGRTREVHIHCRTESCLRWVSSPLSLQDSDRSTLQPFCFCVDVETWQEKKLMNINDLIYQMGNSDDHFICSFNLNNPETTVCIVFKMTNIASGDQLFVNSLIGNDDQTANSKFITFYRTYSGLGLLISKAQSGSYVAIANDESSSIKPDLKFPSPKSNCTILNKWHVISVTWSKRENLSNCWSNGAKL